jgi:4-nitrocatechol/4-nitrophenol 4-monooxygenase
LLDAFPLSEALIAVIDGREPDSLLDAWAVERRRVFLEVTVPTATENRRRVSERDPEKKRADEARLQKLTVDREAARLALLGVFRLVGRSPQSPGG